MRLFLTCLGPLAFVVLLSGQTPGARPADEAAVRAVVQKYLDAREARDPQAVEALFTSDADQQTTSGQWRRGRAEIVPGTLGSSEQNAGARTIRVESVRFLTQDVAIADGPYTIAPASGEAPRRMWTTIVLTRGPDGWRIAAIRNMVPTTAAQ